VFTFVRNPFVTLYLVRLIEKIGEDTAACLVINANTAQVQKDWQDLGCVYFGKDICAILLLIKMI
jgi:hypothetical protein